jgi:hypothetical protein
MCWYRKNPWGLEIVRNLVQALSGFSFPATYKPPWNQKRVGRNFTESSAGRRAIMLFNNITY